MSLDHLIPEIDEAIVLTEDEIAKWEAKRTGSGHQLASFVKSLRIMQDRIRDDSLTLEQRESFYAGLGRGMLDE